MTSPERATPSLLSAPEMNTLADAYESNDVVFLSPSKSRTIAEALRAFARSEKQRSEPMDTTLLEISMDPANGPSLSDKESRPTEIDRSYALSLADAIENCRVTCKHEPSAFDLEQQGYDTIILALRAWSERSASARGKHWVYAAAEATLPLALELHKTHPHTGGGHVRWMLRQIIEEQMSPTKACRWLGWAQACLCEENVATLEQLKAINKAASDAAPLYVICGQSKEP